MRISQTVYIMVSLYVSVAFCGQASMIQFYDSTGSTRTAKFGWSGDATNGKFVIETPNDGNGIEAKNGNVTIDGTVTSGGFVGNGSGLVNVPIQGHSHSGDSIKSGTINSAYLQNGSYMIDGPGTTGKVWKSDGVGKGYWGTDSLTGNLSMGQVEGLNSALAGKASLSGATFTGKVSMADTAAIKTIVANNTDDSIEISAARLS